MGWDNPPRSAAVARTFPGAEESRGEREAASGLPGPAKAPRQAAGLGGAGRAEMGLQRPSPGIMKQHRKLGLKLPDSSLITTRGFGGSLLVYLSVAYKSNPNVTAFGPTKCETWKGVQIPVSQPHTQKVY